MLMIIADLQRTNRVLMEDVFERVKLLQYGEPKHPLVGEAAPVLAAGADSQPRSYAPPASENAVTDDAVVDQWAEAARREAVDPRV